MARTLNLIVHLYILFSRCLRPAHLLFIPTSHHSGSSEASIFISTTRVQTPRGPALIPTTAGVPFHRDGPSESDRQIPVSKFCTSKKSCSFLSNDLSLLNYLCAIFTDIVHLIFSSISAKISSVSINCCTGSLYVCYFYEQ